VQAAPPTGFRLPRLCREKHSVAPFNRSDDKRAKGSAHTLHAGKVSNVLSCKRPEPEHLVLHGSYEGEEIAVRLKRLDEAQFPHMKSRFQLISGFP
jgi:hypothetical protein